MLVFLISLNILMALVILVLFYINKYYRLALDKLDVQEFMYETYYKILSLWFFNMYRGKSIGEYLSGRNIKTIAIYGAGNLGKFLYFELKKYPEIKVSYFIDQSVSIDSYEDVPVKKVDEIKFMPEVDVVIITPVYVFDSIKENLTKLGIKNIQCIDDLIYEINGKRGIVL